MTKLERLHFINQYLILEKLYPNEADYFEKLRIALEKGYKSYYTLLTENIDDEMPSEQSNKVSNILNMYRCLNNSYYELDDKTEINPKDIKFKGFDGNDEAEYLAYVEYIIDTLGLFRESKLDDYNTHFPVLDEYEKMLKVWKKYEKFERLNKDQIKEIIKG